MPTINPISDARKVTVFLNGFIIEGHIHLQFRNTYKGRLSDHLNNTNTSDFLPITDATMIDAGSSKIVKKSQCIIINKTQIDSIIEEELT